ncbi:MAG TPA: XrtA/PEP-CTERM system exopolysaccharide export protein [Allosphingosinicella sp.]|nr:XrtA/PEP-CTERM system exopolysaccharide export protein [Allosphingosinicella sp.]
MRKLASSTLALALGFGVIAAADAKGRDQLPPASFVGSDESAPTTEKYVIGALDQLNVFVWRNADLGGKVQVRPDGMITTPLIPDLQAAGKTPAELAEDIRQALTKYVDDPRVTVMVESFQGSFSQQIRVVGATEKPASLPYRANMTLLDAMIAVGGLSEYAAGNRARLIRHDRATGTQKEYDLKIARLLKKGDTSANVRLEPGDVIIIPESMF